MPGVGVSSWAPRPRTAHRLTQPLCCSSSETTFPASGEKWEIEALSCGSERTILNSFKIDFVKDSTSFLKMLSLNFCMQSLKNWLSVIVFQNIIFDFKNFEALFIVKFVKVYTHLLLNTVRLSLPGESDVDDGTFLQTVAIWQFPSEIGS